MSVANAGYPSAQYNLARISGDLAPAVHVGTVSAVVNRGRLIENDVQSLPGNSGGPLFDPATGDVVGVVVAKLKGSTDANVAIGIGTVVAPFLKQHDIAYEVAPEAPSSLATSSSSAPSVNDPGPLKTLPGAGRVAIVYDSSKGTGNAPAIIAAAAAEFAQKFGQRFSVQTMTVEAPINSVAELVEAAHGHDAIIAIPFGAGFQFTSSVVNQYGQDHNITLTLGTSVIDPYGFVWFGAKKEKKVYSHRDPYSAVTSSFADLSDQVLGTMAHQLKNASAGDNTARVNLFRYVPMSKRGSASLHLQHSRRQRRAGNVLPPFSPGASDRRHHHVNQRQFDRRKDRPGADRSVHRRGLFWCGGDGSRRR